MNNSGFQVERKTDGSEWSEISFISGLGTTTEISHYTFRDQSLTNGKYSYRLKQIDFDGTYSYSNEIEVEVTPPNKYALYQNYPNPFNPSTIIAYYIPEESFVTLTIYDLQGKEIARPVQVIQGSGHNEINWNADNFASGIYLYKIEAVSVNNAERIFTDVRKMNLLK